MYNEYRLLTHGEVIPEDAEVIISEDMEIYVTQKCMRDLYKNEKRYLSGNTYDLSTMLAMRTKTERKGA